MNYGSYINENQSEKEKKMITQDEVRQKLIRKMQEGQQQYIAKQIGVPKQILSNFKTGKRELWESSLQALNDYLDSH